MPAGFDPATYNTVAERIEAFIAKYPEGSLQAEVIELSDHRVVMRGLAYRSPEDTHPGIGHSAMPIPATNSMLRNSEIETAETSAWGRAIAALGFEVKKGVATSNEIEAKSGQEPEAPSDGSLIGTVELGKPPVDLSLRQTPNGNMFGFRLGNGRKKYQVVATGALADALNLMSLEAGTRAQVWGPIEMVPWDKDGKTMPPYARVALTRIQTSDFTLPAPEEAESAPLFDETELADVVA